MREKKYANILDEDAKKNKKDLFIDEDSEEELSTTRELKFKELQEELNKENVENDEELEDEEVNEVEDENEEDILEDVQDGSKLSLEDDDKEFIKSKKKNKKDDDIYLTTSFKPFYKKFRIGKVFKFLFSVCLLVLICFGGWYYGFKPLYERYLDSKPIRIYQRAIDEVVKFVVGNEEVITENIDSYYMDLNFKLDSNIKKLEVFNDINFGTLVGVDTKNKYFREDVYINEDDERHSINYFEKDNKYYYKYSNSNKYLMFPLEQEDIEADKDFYNYREEILEYLSVLFNGEFKYAYKVEADILKKVLKEEYFDSEKDEIEVNNTKVEVTRNVLTLTKSNLEEMKQEYLRLLKENKEVMEIYSKIFKTSEDKVIELLDKNIQIPNDTKVIINLYINKNREFAGIDVEVNGFTILYCYLDKGNFTLHANLTQDEECLSGTDCVQNREFVIDLYGTKNGNVTDVDVKYNTAKIGTLHVRSFTKEKISFDYEINFLSLKCKGDLLLFLGDNQTNVDFSLRYDKKYINANVNVIYEFNKKFIDEFSIDSVIDGTKAELSKVDDQFYKKLKSMKLDELFTYWIDIVDAVLYGNENDVTEEEITDTEEKDDNDETL